jgi:hypothetical protein
LVKTQISKKFDWSIKCKQIYGWSRGKSYNKSFQVNTEVKSLKGIQDIKYFDQTESIKIPNYFIKSMHGSACTRNINHGTMLTTALS